MNRTNKWLLWAAGAILLLASCGRVQTPDAAEESLRKITFQTARYRSVTKGNTDYKEKYANVPFGVYSWYKGETSVDDAVFMENEPVSYDEPNNRWAPTRITYYWPKSGSLDFICYSPYTADGAEAPLPVVVEDQISYPLWNVKAFPTVDVMYADKASGLSSSSTAYYYNGVPTLFHHALTYLTFKIRAAYLQKTADTGDTTRWEIDLNGVQLKDIQTTGSLAMDLAADGKTWTTPDPAIWTSDGASVTDVDLDTDEVPALTTEPQVMGASMLVLPQALTGDQKVVLNVTIRTYRDNGTGEQLVLTETGINLPASLANASLTNWCMNQHITYVFILAPSQAAGTGVDSDGDGIEDTDPVSVYFDPAVDDWQNIEVEAGINL